MSLAQAKAALIAPLTTANFLAPIGDIMWENQKFDASGKKFWAAVYFVPDSNPTVATLGAPGMGATDNHDGFLQIDLNYPADSGDGDAMEKYDAIRNLFTAGARFSYQGQAVTVRSCGRSQGRIVENFYRVIVTIVFYARIPR